MGFGRWDMGPPVPTRLCLVGRFAYEGPFRHNGPVKRKDLTQGRLEALAHPARVAMVRLLAELPDEHTLRDPRCGTAYGVCFCHLKEKTGLSAPTVSHHLRILREAGLVEGVRVGRWTYYRLRPGALEALAQELLSLARQARRALEEERAV
jgi:ArsR family transcriptional regulator